MNDEVKEILKGIESYENDDLCLIVLSQKENKALLDYITNLQQENERLKARLTDTEWQYDNMRIKVEKQYIKGITEELIEDIETCFFNGEEKPDLIPIDSLDVCHIFGYIDYLKDYKSRCEKAIEYIKQEDWNTEYDYNLLNILQNGSEENVSDRD